MSSADKTENAVYGGQPYPYLYIYYLKGRLGSFTGYFGRHFIGNWEEEGFSFLFFSQPADEVVRQFLENHSSLVLLDQYQMTYEEWQGGKFCSFPIGRFVIVPPWENDDAKVLEPGQIKIILDPGVVFGNGLHPTTRDCIEALELLFSHENIESALDLGCGTGILALVAASLGCRRCIALDFNLLASQTAYRNVRINALAKKIVVAQARAENFVDLPTDLLIANIHYDIMEELLACEGFFQKKWFILSGLLKSQARNISERLKRPEVKILKAWERDDIWHTFCGKIS